MVQLVTAEYIEKIEVVKKLRDYLKKVLGVDISFLPVNGHPIQFHCDKIHKNSCAESGERCTQVPADLVAKMMLTQEYIIFCCTSGAKKMLLPLVFEKNVVGAMFIAENGGYKFNGFTTQALAEMLQYGTGYILKHELATFGSVKGSQLTYQQEILSKATRYIEENYHKSDLTLKEVSDTLGVSYHYLSHLFKRGLNRTFVHYRNKMRMEGALKLLKKRSLTIGQVAYACGFDDPGYFCKVFKETFRRPPVVFRKRISESKKLPYKNKILQ